MLENDVVLIVGVNMLKDLFDGDILTDEFIKILLLKISDHTDMPS